MNRGLYTVQSVSHRINRPDKFNQVNTSFFFLSLFFFDRQEEILYIYKAQQSTHNI